jgi:hypothetical protein
MNNILEYMKIHLISLKQDYDKLPDGDRDSVIHLNGQVLATSHLLSVAKGMIETMNTTDLEPRLQKLIDMGESGTDILHGELKNLMLVAEQEYTEIATEEEEGGYSDAMLSMDRTRAEGRLDALVEIYELTYQLAFAINERRVKNGDV